MKQRYTFAVAFATIFLVSLIIFFFNSGAGHGWGTGALFIISLPLGAIPFGLEEMFPNYGFALLFPVFGLTQYIILGYWVGRWFEKKATIK